MNSGAGINHLIAHPDASFDDLYRTFYRPWIFRPAALFTTKRHRSALLCHRAVAALSYSPKTEIVEDKGGQFYRIIVTEIPYQINKSNPTEKNRHLGAVKKIDGIKDLRDESNKDGVRVVVELKKDSYPKKF